MESTLSLAGFVLICIVLAIIAVFALFAVWRAFRKREIDPRIDDDPNTKPVNLQREIDEDPFIK